MNLLTMVDQDGGEVAVVSEVQSKAATNNTYLSLLSSWPTFEIFSWRASGLKRKPKTKAQQSKGRSRY